MTEFSVFVFVLSVCLLLSAICGIILAYMSFNKFLKKEKRIVDEQFLNSIEWQKCTACGKQGPNDAHHVTSRGAGGGDTWDNCMSLCRLHHTEWHQIGPGKMIKKYPTVLKWLKDKQREDVIERSDR